VSELGRRVFSARKQGISRLRILESHCGERYAQSTYNVPASAILRSYHRSVLDRLAGIGNASCSRPYTGRPTSASVLQLCEAKRFVYENIDCDSMISRKIEAISSLNCPLDLTSCSSRQWQLTYNSKVLALHWATRTYCLLIYLQGSGKRSLDSHQDLKEKPSKQDNRSKRQN